MIWFMKWRGLRPPEIAAFAVGFLIWWGGTDFSVFEVLIVATGIATLVWCFRNKRAITILDRLDARVWALVGFVILVILQFLYASTNIPVFAAITIYLTGLYFLARFWLQQNTGLFNYFVFAYLVTALAMSAIGFGRYLLAIVPIEWWLPYEIRWRGFLDDPVVFASLLVPAILVFGHMAVYVEHKRRFTLYVVAALFCFSNLILTGSRGAWLGLIVSAIVLVLLDRGLLQGRHFFRVLIGTASAFILALLLVYIVPLAGRTYHASTLEHRGAASDTPRVDNLLLAPKIIFERPWFEIALGSGSGSYEHFSPNGFSAHNTYLRVLFEQGVAGLALFFAFLYLTIRAVWQSASYDRRKAVLLTSLIAGIMIHSLFVDTLHWRHFWLILALI